MHKLEFPDHHRGGGSGGRKQEEESEPVICHRWRLRPGSEELLSSLSPTSLAEAGALQAVACLVCSGHQGLGEAAVGKNGTVRRAAQTGPVAGEITLVLGGRAPPIHHGPCGTPQG